MWLFIHRPFEVWPQLAELRIERVYMLITLAYWAIQPKVWTSSRLNLGIGLLALSIALSAMFSPYEGFESQTVQNWLKIAVFWLLLMTSVQTIDHFKTIVIAFAVVMGLYELHSLREYLSGRGEYRMGTWRMVGVDNSLNDPNSFAASVVCGLPILIPLTALAAKTWQRVAIWSLLALGLICIVLTGSRTAFAAIIVVGFAFSMMSPYRWRIVAISAIVAPLVWFNLSQDLQYRYLTLIDPSYGPQNAQDSADSRKQFFVQAVRIWQENPLFGVGPQGFPYASGTGMQCHSLYGVTISELGAFGVFAMVVLLMGYFLSFQEGRNLYKRSQPNSDSLFCYRTELAVGVSVFLLLFLGLGGHNLYRFNWVWCAAFSAFAIKFMRTSILCQTRADSSDVDLELSRAHSTVLSEVAGTRIF